jgi:hypothetical protein
MLVAIDGEGLRPPARIITKLVGLVLVALPPLILSWPWEWLPLRWQRPRLIGEAEPVLSKAMAFRATNGRYPMFEEMPELEGVSFTQVPGGFMAQITESFDSFLIFDSRRNSWERRP